MRNPAVSPSLRSDPVSDARSICVALQAVCARAVVGSTSSNTHDRPAAHLKRGSALSAGTFVNDWMPARPARSCRPPTADQSRKAGPNIRHFVGAGVQIKKERPKPLSKKMCVSVTLLSLERSHNGAGMAKISHWRGRTQAYDY